MKQIFNLILGIFFLCTENIWSCTNFIAGKNATTDGSTIVTYNADSHTLYGELYHWPAAEWSEGSWLEIKEWDTGKPLGRIPQVAKTYAVVGNMNEYQVTIGETTFGGRAELVDTTAIMDYGSLIYIALQRSKTAREAIRVMTELVEKYGYCSEGESFSIADPNEAWIMEMIGKGSDYKGAVWVAVRIPDDCVSGHANQSRIRQFPLDDPDNYLYSSDVISFARQKGYFSGTNTAFSFADAYAPADIETLRSCDVRIWCFFHHVKSGMERYLPYIKGQSNESMPLYVKPDRKLSVQDFKSFMRDHFEGTEFDMNNDIGAGPFHVPYRWRPLEFTVDSVKYVNERATATQQTGFSFVAQMRNWLPGPIGGVLWFGVDDANTNVYIPMYCGITEIPECFRVGNGDLLTFSWTSAFWIYNWVANMSYSKYDYMIKDIRPVQDSLENKFNKELSSIDLKAKALYTNDPQAALKMVTEYSCKHAQETTLRWKKLGEFLMVKYIDGNVKKEQNGIFKRNTWGQPESPDQPGYDQRYYRSIVNETGNKFRITRTIDDKK